VHEQRIVHSDLKPANFLLVEGQLKLIDFGIAKAICGDTTSIARESQVRPQPRTACMVLAVFCGDTTGLAAPHSAGCAYVCWTWCCFVVVLVHSLCVCCFTGWHAELHVP
jgi:serine/threonine protein kinase